MTQETSAVRKIQSIKSVKVCISVEQRHLRARLTTNIVAESFRLQLSRMTITIEEVDSGLARVEWTTEIHRAGHTDETFRLERFHPCTSYVVVCYSSSLSIDDVDSKIGTRTHYTELCLMRILSPLGDGVNDDSTSNEGVGSDLDYRHRPCAVWASINGGEKCILKESPSSGTWKSEKFLVNFARTRRPDVNNWAARVWKPAPLVCLLWIEFETFSRGEKNVLRRLTDMYVRQAHCDVQFSLEGDQQIGGHVSILSAMSPVFAAMFQHNMREAETGRVVIEDVRADIFKQLLHFIYSGRIGTPLNEVTAQPLFLAADKYDVSDLKDDCVDFLLTCVRVDNALNLMAWAHIHNIDKLKEAALTFTAQHGQEICLLEDWEELTRNYPDLCVIVTRRIIEQMSISLNEREYSLN